MPILESPHYTAFGLITHAYASVEFGIKAALAGILEVPLIEGMIITEPYSAAQLKNVAKSLVKESMLSQSDQETFINIVGSWSAFSRLRNQIAHLRWQRGERPNAVRPVGLDIRSGKAKWIVSEDTRDWTAEELLAEGQKLARLNGNLQKFHADVGIQQILEAKDADRARRKMG